MLVAEVEVPDGCWGRKISEARSWPDPKQMQLAVWELSGVSDAQRKRGWIKLHTSMPPVRTPMRCSLATASSMTSPLVIPFVSSLATKKVRTPATTNAAELCEMKTDFSICPLSVKFYDVDSTLTLKPDPGGMVPETIKSNPLGPRPPPPLGKNRSRHSIMAAFR